MWPNPRIPYQMSSDRPRLAPLRGKSIMVNPVVAIALGWLFYREPFGFRETAAMLVIFAGVAIVKRYGRH